MSDAFDEAEAQDEFEKAERAQPASDAPVPGPVPGDEPGRKIGQPTSREKRWGQVVSFLSGSPLFGTVAKAGDALTGQTSQKSAQRATEQFSPKAAGVPVLPVLGGIAATAPAGAARIGGTVGGMALNTARASAGARVGLQAGLGGVQAADRGGDAGDVALGTGMGALAGFLGEGAGAVGQRVVKGAASRIGNVVQGRAAKDVADVAGDVARLEGQYGAAAQALNRTNENLTRQVAGLPSASGSLLPAQTQQKALGTLTDPDTIAALTQIAERDVANLPGKTAEYTRLQAASQAARAGAPAEAAKRTQDYFGDSVFKTEVAPRLGALGQRAAVAGLAGGVSSLLDGGFGAGVAGVMGGQGLLTMGRNLAKSPRVQRSVLEGVASMAGAVAPVARRAGAVARESISDPMGPLRKYLGLSPEERLDASAQAFGGSQ